MASSTPVANANTPLTGGTEPAPGPARQRSEPAETQRQFLWRWFRIIKGCFVIFLPFLIALSLSYFVRAFATCEAGQTVSRLEQRVIKIPNWCTLGVDKVEAALVDGSVSGAVGDPAALDGTGFRKVVIAAVLNHARAGHSDRCEVKPSTKSSSFESDAVPAPPEKFEVDPKPTSSLTLIDPAPADEPDIDVEVHLGKTPHPPLALTRAVGKKTAAGEEKKGSDAKLKIAWRTDDETIATVDPLGQITGRARGKTVLYAQTEEGTTRALLHVRMPVFADEKLMGMCSYTFGIRNDAGDWTHENPTLLLFRGGFVAEAIVQGLLVLLFPGFFIARHLIDMRAYNRKKKKDGEKKAAGIVDEERTDNLIVKIEEERAVLRLNELTRPSFFRPLGFALLVALGTQYILAPAGMQASMIATFGVLLPDVGMMTHPFESVFMHPAAYVVGFGGYYLYALTTFMLRWHTGTASQLVYLHLFRRGIIVWLMSLVVSGIAVGAVGNVIVFLVGIFPDIGIPYLMKAANLQTGGLQGTEFSLGGFQSVPEINWWRQLALSDLGVTDAHDLAHAEWRSLIVRSGLQPRMLLKAADRALLLTFVGTADADKLVSLRVTTASELALLFAEDQDALIEEALDAKNVTALRMQVMSHPNIAWARSQERLAAEVPSEIPK